MVGIIVALVNMILIPFAYLMAIAHKFFILIRKPTWGNFGEFFLFLFFGLIFLLVGIIPDFIRFVHIAYDEDVVRV